MNVPSKVTSFDGDAYILHHWATRYGIPYKFLIIINPTDLPIRDLTAREIQSKLNIFQSLLSEGVTLEEITRRLDLSMTDSSMIYALMSLKRRNLGRSSRGLPRLTKPDETELAVINAFAPVRTKIHTLHFTYNSWWIKFRKDVANHLANMMRLEEIRNVIASVSVPFLPRSSFSVSKVSISGYPVWSSMVHVPEIDKGKITGQDGLDIFNRSKVSCGLPFIELDYTVGQIQPEQFRGRHRRLLEHELIEKETQKSIYKIYYSGLTRMTADFSRMIRDSSEGKLAKKKRLTKKKRPNRIKMTVWSGVGDVASAPKDSFLPVIYNLDTNSLELTVSAISSKWQASVEPERTLVSGVSGGIRLMIRQPEGQGSNLVASKIQTSRIVQKRILSALPSIQIDEWEETEVNGHFKIFGLDIEEIGLLDLILLNKLFRAYFYVNERNAPGAAKRKLYLHFRSVLEIVDIEPSRKQAKIKMSYLQYVTQPGQKYKIQLSEGLTEMKEFPTGTPYVEFSLLKAPNQQEAERVINTVSKLFQYYMNFPQDKSLRNREIEKYNYYVPELGKENRLAATSSTIRPKQPAVQTAKDVSKITLLKRVAPEVFVSNYATDCQKSEQPIPIKDDIPSWVKKKFIHGGQLRDRQILHYPPMRVVRENPSIDKQWKFICPDDKFPFPGMKKNKQQNKDKYQYVPCCYTKDHMDEAANSDYNEYYRGIPTKQIQTKTQQYINKTSKIIPAGNFGVAPKSISKLLAINDESGTTYQVMGMPNNPNSFLDCILTAISLKEPEYRRIISVKDKIQYVRNYRRLLRLRFESGQIRTELLKQELYDQSSEQIINGLTNQDLFMDPALYYRVLEEIYGINIFVFVSKQGNTINQLEIPRHRDFYVRTKRSDRPTVLIYKHPVSIDRGGVKTTAQCELILRKKNNNQFYQYHPVDNSQTISVLFNLFYRTTSIMEWIIDTGLISFNQRQVIQRDGLNQTNFVSFSPKQYITHQILDDYGKFRGLVFAYPQSSTGSNPQTIIMITPPAQPLNLPNWTGGEIPTLGMVISFFSKNKVTGASYIDIQNRSIDGLWYQIHDRIFGIYFPIKPVTPSDQYPVGPDIPLNLSMFRRNVMMCRVQNTVCSLVRNPLSRVVRIRGLRKMNNMILNIIKWLFVISRKTLNMTADQFIQSLLISGPPVGGKSFSKYNLSHVPHRFPNISNINQAIQYLSRIAKGLIRENKVYLYSRKYFDSISYFLKNYEKNTEGLDIEIPVVIPGRLMDVDDFIANQDNLIFMTQNELINWLDSLDRDQRNSDNIVKTIDRSLVSRIHPYILMVSKDSFYLIQNAYPEKIKVTPLRKKSAQTIIVGAPVGSSTIPTLPPVFRRATQFILTPESSESSGSSDQLIISTPASQILIIPTPSRPIEPLKPEIPKGSLPRALNIAQTWKTRKINLGYYAQMIDIRKPFPPYKLYSISVSKILFLKDDKSNDSPNPLIILEYSEGIYAAMLPL